MSSDSIKRLDGLRNYYKSQNNTSSASAEVKVLNEIKAELTIMNDEKSIEAKPITNKTGSPYLQDQEFYYKEAVYNGPTESDWKEVKTYDQTYGSLSSFNLKKLNII